MEVDDLRSVRFTALFEAHYDAVLHYAQRRIDRTVAADIAADVFLVAWRRLDELPRDELPWLLVTARHTLANHRRATDRASSLHLRLRNHSASASLDNSLAEEVTTRRRWATAFAALSASDQDVLALTVWEGLTAAQGAKVIGCGVSAYVMRLHRARRHLRQLLADHGTPDPARRARPPATAPNSEPKETPT